MAGYMADEKELIALKKETKALEEAIKEFVLANVRAGDLDDARESGFPHASIENFAHAWVNVIVPVLFYSESPGLIDMLEEQLDMMKGSWAEMSEAEKSCER